MLDAIGGLPKDAAKFVSGGPMMGKAVANLEASTLKATSALLFLTEAETKRKEESNCIRCGKCIDARPMGLEPYLLNKLSRIAVCMMNSRKRKSMTASNADAVYTPVLHIFLCLTLSG